MALKYPAIPSMTKYSVHFSEYPAIGLKTSVNRPPDKAPSTSSGRKVPPGSPLPKLMAEDTYLTAKRSSKNPASNFPWPAGAMSCEPLPSV